MKKDNDVANKIMLIRVPKTASRCMARTLELEPVGGHKSASFLAANRPAEFEESIKVACFRDPFDRLVSWHRFHCERHPDAKMYGGVGVEAFREWVARGCPTGFWRSDKNADPLVQKNWTMVNGENRAIILRFHRLQDDWAKVMVPLGAPPLARPVNTARRGVVIWRRWYDQSTYDRAKQIVRPDLDWLHANRIVLPWHGSF